MGNMITVKVDGHSIRMRAEGGRGYVEELAAHVEHVMASLKQATGNAASDKVAVMAAMKIADEYFQLKQRLEGEARERERRMNALIATSERLLKNG